MYFDHTERPHSLDNYEASLFVSITVSSLLYTVPRLYLLYRYLSASHTAFFQEKEPLSGLMTDLGLIFPFFLSRIIFC